MKVTTHHSKHRTGWLSGLGLVLTMCATGCQVDVGGLTLPSPYWQQDDIQYFPPGHEFKLYNEAAAMKAAKANDAALSAPPSGPAPGVAVPVPPGMPGPVAPGGVVPVPPAAAPVPLPQ